MSKYLGIIHDITHLPPLEDWALLGTTDPMPGEDIFEVSLEEIMEEYEEYETHKDAGDPPPGTWEFVQAVKDYYDRHEIRYADSVMFVTDD